MSEAGDQVYLIDAKFGGDGLYVNEHTSPAGRHEWRLSAHPGILQCSLRWRPHLVCRRMESTIPRMQMHEQSLYQSPIKPRAQQSDSHEQEIGEDSLKPSACRRGGKAYLLLSTTIGGCADPFPGALDHVRERFQ